MPDPVLTDVAAALRDQHADLGVGPLSLWARGSEFLVYRAGSPGGDVVVRVPTATRFSTSNDPDQDTRASLEHEHRLSAHLRGLGFPVPAMLALHLAEDRERRDFLVAELVPGDGGPARPVELGALVRRLHRLPAPPFGLLAEGRTASASAAANAVVCARLERRLAALRARTGQRLTVPLIGAADLGPDPVEPSLLHLDLRPENVLARGGEVLALIDWSNALRGHPALDIARLAEYGNLVDGFLEGYGLDPFATVSPVTELVYRLDTAVMLAHVFAEHEPNPTRAAVQLARVGELCAELRRVA